VIDAADPWAQFEVVEKEALEEKKEARRKKALQSTYAKKRSFWQNESVVRVLKVYRAVKRFITHIIGWVKSLSAKVAPREYGEEEGKDEEGGDTVALFESTKPIPSGENPQHETITSAISINSTKSLSKNDLKNGKNQEGIGGIGGTGGAGGAGEGGGDEESPALVEEEEREVTEAGKTQLSYTKIHIKPNFLISISKIPIKPTFILKYILNPP
jgi:hypothetical protein